MKRTNIVTWLLVVALTLTAYLCSEANLTGTALVVFLMAITLIKFTAISWQFVELKISHVVWQLLFAGFMLIFTLMVVVFSKV